jgi:hypothetical protein
MFLISLISCAQSRILSTPFCVAAVSIGGVRRHLLSQASGAPASAQESTFESRYKVPTIALHVDFIENTNNLVQNGASAEVEEEGLSARV